jgi:hypothetical protein
VNGRNIQTSHSRGVVGEDQIGQRLLDQARQDWVDESRG